MCHPAIYIFHGPRQQISLQQPSHREYKNVALALPSLRGCVRCIAQRHTGQPARVMCTCCRVQVVWNPHDARPRERAPAQKRRSPDDSSCDLPGAPGGPTSDAHPVQRAAKRHRATVAEGIEEHVEAMKVEADFEVLPTTVQKENRAERAKRRAAATAGVLQVCAGGLLMPLNRFHAFDTCNSALCCCASACFCSSTSHHACTFPHTICSPYLQLGIGPDTARCLLRATAKLQGLELVSH